MSIEKSKFSRREWLMIIAIFLMAEAWILNLSYAFVDEQSVINYVSFASTITSLILAILAIIYGFYQSENGKKSNAALESNIDALQDTQSKLDVFISSVDVQLKSINNSAGKLEKIGETFDVSIGKIDDLRKEVVNFGDDTKKSHDALYKALSQSIKESYGNKIVSDNVDNKLLNSIFSNSSITLDLISVMLVAAYEREYDGNIVDLAIDHYAMPINRAIQDDFDKDDFFKAFSLGSLARYALDIIKISSYLGAFDIFDSKNIKLNKDFVEMIRSSSDIAFSADGTKHFAKYIKNSFDK